MRKNIFLLVILFAFFNVFSQKSKFDNYEFELAFEQPEIFKNFETFSYEIQDDGLYWNHNYEEEESKPENYKDFPTLRSLTQGLEIAGLDEVDVNPDLKIVVGFKGSQLKSSQQGRILIGTMNIMMIIHGDKLMHNVVKDINVTIPAYNDKYPGGNRFFRNKAKAMILTKEVQKYIKDFEPIFSGTSKVRLYFGEFKKAKKDKATEFNKISKPMVEEIVASKSTEIIKKAIEYWKGELDVDYGKKLKEKYKLKVIHTNIASAYILLNNREKATEHAKLAEKHAGFFDSFTGGYSNYSKKLNFIENYKEPELIEVSQEGKYMYEFVFNEEGQFDLGKKKRNFTKLILERFVATTGSNVVSLDSAKTPTVKLFVGEDPTYIYTCNQKNKIILNNGKTISFKLVKGEFLPFVKNEENKDVQLF